MRRVITRSASYRSTSGSFLQPLEVDETAAGKVEISFQDDEGYVISVWPDEAQKLALALLSAAFRVDPLL